MTILLIFDCQAFLPKTPARDSVQSLHREEEKGEAAAAVFLRFVPLIFLVKLESSQRNLAVPLSSPSLNAPLVCLVACGITFTEES